MTDNFHMDSFIVIQPKLILSTLNSSGVGCYQTDQLSHRCFVKGSYFIVFNIGSRGCHDTFWSLKRAQPYTEQIVYTKQIIWCANKRVSQMRAPLAAYRVVARGYNRFLMVLYVFDIKRNIFWFIYFNTRIVILWHISDMAQGLRRVKFVIAP